MSRIFDALLYILACATRQERAWQVQYLKTEKEILRSKLPKRITVAPKKRRKLVRAGRKLGTAIEELITIVSPRTFACWVSREADAKNKPAKKVGRPRTPEEIRELVVKIATETGWGYTCILSELRKLGIRKVARQSVVNIPKSTGWTLVRSAARKRGKQGPFADQSGKRKKERAAAVITIKIHADTLWQCDFVSKPMWAMKGLVDLYFVVFLHLGMRRYWISPCTLSPDSAWVSQQAKNFLMEADDLSLMPKYMMRDNDTKFFAQFDEVFTTSGVEIRRTVPLSPNLRAHVERFIQSLKQECRDRFVIVAERHLNYVNREWRLHYNRERPHEARGHLPPAYDKPPEAIGSIRPKDVICSSRLGGLLKHYERRAA